jgi:hypothetical protein
MRVNLVKTKRNTEEKDKDALHRVRLPGFLIEQEVGLGDVIKRASAVVGIRPCGGCERRAAALNRWMTFTR